MSLLLPSCSRHVIFHQENNKMNKSNMSALIGPNIMRRLSPSPLSMLKDVRDSNVICTLLYDHYAEIFAHVYLLDSMLFCICRTDSCWSLGHVPGEGKHGALPSRSPRGWLPSPTLTVRLYIPFLFLLFNSESS